MVIGSVESTPCPARNSDAEWRNHDTCWKIYCFGFCDDYSITNNTVNHLTG